MFTRIYKLTDDKWHVIDWTANKHIPTLRCGIELSYGSVVEDRMIGEGSKDCKKDPDRKDCCSVCFDFLSVIKEIK